jgi:hypothetical protein
VVVVELSPEDSAAMMPQGRAKNPEAENQPPQCSSPTTFQPPEYFSSDHDINGKRIGECRILSSFLSSLNYNHLQKFVFAVYNTFRIPILFPSLIYFLIDPLALHHLLASRIYTRVQLFYSPEA